MSRHEHQQSGTWLSSVGRALPPLGVVLLTLAWVWWSAVPKPAQLVLITIDTTRADRLSLYGFADATMPALERLARDGVVFDQAISVAPLTLPAHTSLFTGLFPPGHGVRDNAGRALDENHTTLAEVLRDRGYCTGAFVSSVVLDPSRGLAQGFEHYAGVLPGARREATPLQRRADEVVADAIRWFDGIGT